MYGRSSWFRRLLLLLFAYPPAVGEAHQIPAPDPCTTSGSRSIIDPQGDLGLDRSAMDPLGLVRRRTLLCDLVVISPDSPTLERYPEGSFIKHLALRSSTSDDGRGVVGSEAVVLKTLRLCMAGGHVAAVRAGRMRPSEAQAQAASVLSSVEQFSVRVSEGGQRLPCPCRRLACMHGTIHACMGRFSLGYRSSRCYPSPPGRPSHALVTSVCP